MLDSSKNASRARRARKIRYQIIGSGVSHRLQVHRTNLHIYAQILDRDAKVIVSASSAEAEVRKTLSNGGNLKAATEVGARIAQKAKEKGLEQVAFDRSGFKYHGRIKALAEAAREAGLQF
ncbi:MAG: 50S ribosomal protein L18 [Burkholderiales bacterium]|nr:50S ribosomal protein L18 [Burkholderiales bacterium]